MWAQVYLNIPAHPWHCQLAGTIHVEPSAMHHS